MKSKTMSELNELKELFYSIPETALILKVGKSTLYNLVDSGEIHSIKLGNRKVIPRTVIEAFLNLPA